MKPKKSFWCRVGLHKWSEWEGRGLLKMNEGPRIGQSVGVMRSRKCVRPGCDQEHDDCVVW